MHSKELLFSKCSPQNYIRRHWWSLRGKGRRSHLFKEYLFVTSLYRHCSRFCTGSSVESFIKVSAVWFQAFIFFWMLILSNDFYIVIPNCTYFPRPSRTSSFPAFLIHFFSAIYTHLDALEREVNCSIAMFAIENFAEEHHLCSLVVWWFVTPYEPWALLCLIIFVCMEFFFISPCSHHSSGSSVPTIPYTHWISWLSNS